MKVLLLGDYSGLHLNLAQGLKMLNIDVTVASNGDGWKDIPRNVDLKQPEKFKRIRFLTKLSKALPQLKGYDIVQLINPIFLGTHPWLNDLVFQFIKKHNQYIFLGANGMDYYYCSYAMQGKLKHSVFQVPDIKDDPLIKQHKQALNNKMWVQSNINVAKYAHGITACNVGYFMAYKAIYPDKTTHIPLPIDTSKYAFINNINKNTKAITFFIGKIKGRERRKGIDVIERNLLNLKQKYPHDVMIKTISNLPTAQYTKELNDSHVLCDQKYSYGIGMNALIGLSKGLITGSGADEEMYQLIGENKNRPIINLNVSDNDMLNSFEKLIANKSKLREQAIASRNFAIKHHDTIKIAQEYIDFWKSKM
ncbi:glycosyltransferase family protein [Saccharicrinis fermentans]|nr:hypothetical protein [Saccharicrinis fermentans]